MNIADEIRRRTDPEMIDGKFIYRKDRLRMLKDLEVIRYFVEEAEHSLNKAVILRKIDKLSKELTNEKN